MNNEEKSLSKTNINWEIRILEKPLINIDKMRDLVK